MQISFKATTREGSVESFRKCLQMRYQFWEERRRERRMVGRWNSFLQSRHITMVICGRHRTQEVQRSFSTKKPIKLSCYLFTAKTSGWVGVHPCVHVCCNVEAKTWANLLGKLLLMISFFSFLTAAFITHGGHFKCSVKEEKPLNLSCDMRRGLFFLTKLSCCQSFSCHASDCCCCIPLKSIKPWLLAGNGLFHMTLVTKSDFKGWGPRDWNPDWPLETEKTLSRTESL